MPITKSRSIWPTRIAWPRRQGEPLIAPSRPALYNHGESRFTISPLSLTLDQLLWIITAALLAIGLVMVQSAEARVSTTVVRWWLSILISKNLMHVGVSLLVMTIFWRLDYRHLTGSRLGRCLPTYLIAVTVILLVLVLTKFGANINGAKRWLMIPLGFTKLSFQPSELAKWSLVLFIAVYAYHRRELMENFWKGFTPLVMVFGLVAVLVVKEDFGTTALVAIVCFVLLLMSGTRWWYAAMLIPPAMAAAYVAVWHSDYRRQRLLIFLHPETDPKGAGYHAIQSLLSFVSGGFWGRGLGNGIQKMGYLPEDNTDFIFSVIAEELGFVGALTVVLLFVALTLIGWRIAMRCRHLLGKMIAFGLTATIGLQAVINIAVVTVTVPTKGIALPLISSGGTGWIMTAGAIGILMSIERINRLEAMEPSSSASALGFPVVTSRPADRSSL